MYFYIPSHYFYVTIKYIVALSNESTLLLLSGRNDLIRARQHATLRQVESEEIQLAETNTQLKKSRAEWQQLQTDQENERRRQATEQATALINSQQQAILETKAQLRQLQIDQLEANRRSQGCVIT